MSRTFVKPKPSTGRDSARRSDAWRAAAVCGFLVVAVLLVFGRALEFGFLDWDDNVYVYNQSHVSAGVSWSGIVWALAGGPEGDWCPLTMLSHMLDCQVYGLNPIGHHLTNILLHAATAVMLFLVLWRMTGAFWPSALVAALFAVHPLHVESVAWVAERRDVLSGLFFMLTLGAYGEYVRHPRSPWHYLAVVVLLVLGLMAKSILVTLPALLLLLDHWPLARFGRAQTDCTASGPRPFPWRVVVDKLPLFALAIGAAVVTTFTHTPPFGTPLPWPDRLANAAVSCVAYLGQLFVPVGLSPFYPHPQTGMPVWQVAASVTILLAITSAAVILWRSQPYFFVGWFWYVGMLVPVLELVPVGMHARADRYTYLPQIGIYIALVWSAMQLAPSWPARRWVFGIVSGVLLAALMAGAWRQTGFWRDDRTLWEHALDCDPQNIMAHHNLGTALAGKDDRGAEAQYRQAIAMISNDWTANHYVMAKANNDLGEIAVRRGDDADAIGHFEQALKLASNFTVAHLNLGKVLFEQGRLEEAMFHFQRSVELVPDNPTALCCLAVVQARQGDPNGAIVNFRRSIAADSNSAVAHANLAILLAGRNEVDEAIAHYRRALEIDPGFAPAKQGLQQLLKR